MKFSMNTPSNFEGNIVLSHKLQNISKGWNSGVKYEGQNQFRHINNKYYTQMEWQTTITVTTFYNTCAIINNDKTSDNR
jgi:hypothetical protein